MSRSAVAATVAALTIVTGLSAVTAWRLWVRPPHPPAFAAVRNTPRVREAAALSRLRAIPSYRALALSDVIRSTTLDANGSILVDVDVNALVEPRLASLGLSGMADLLPVSARGTILAAAPEGAESTVELTESWLFSGPVPLFDILDRKPEAPSATFAWDAVPGNPSAVVSLRLQPGRLADPDFGGKVLASWRDRAEFAEKLLGRKLRADFAEDLSGPAVFALYETVQGTDAEAIVALELRRSDRIASVLDMLFGLAALTDRATIRRYRGVATGSFLYDSSGHGFAVAVDGTILVVASSRARLESAIDARHAVPGRERLPALGGDRAASWSAVSTSAFAAHGWCRLARCTGELFPAAGTMRALLRPEGQLDWRLDGHGPAPAITADPLVPFLRTVLGKRQRGGGGED